MRSDRTAARPGTAVATAQGVGFWWTEPAMLPRFPHPGAFLSTTSLSKHNKRNRHGQHTPAA